MPGGPASWVPAGLQAGSLLAWPGQRLGGPWLCCPCLSPVLRHLLLSLPHRGPGSRNNGGRSLGRTPLHILTTCPASNGLPPLPRQPIAHSLMQSGVGAPPDQPLTSPRPGLWDSPSQAFAQVTPASPRGAGRTSGPTHRVPSADSLRLLGHQELRVVGLGEIAGLATFPRTPFLR